MWKTVLIATAIAAVLTTGIGAVALGATSGPSSATSPATDAAAQAGTVVIENDRFQPPVVRVEPGTTVTWVNEDDSAHNVVAKDGSWESPILQKGEQFTHTFSDGESARYLCTLHPWMTGSVLVGDQEAPAASPGTGQQNMWQYMQQMHSPEDIEAMRERMDAVHGEGSFDTMLEAVQNGQPCPFAGTGGSGPGGMMGGGTGGGPMGGGSSGGGFGDMMGGGTGGGMMGGGAGGMMGR